MVKIYRLNPENDWVKAPVWQKRIQGFWTYLVTAFAALIWPVETEMAVYTDLKSEFIDEAS